jgi:putative DNA primase/helicase
MTMLDRFNRKSSTQSSIDQPTDARLTLLSRDGFIGKRFFLNKARQLQKEAAGHFTDFTARRIEVGNAFIMKHLVEEMSPGMALVFGIAPHLPEQFNLSDRGHRRNQDTFRFPPCPGWLLLDYDTDQMPDEVRQRIAELGGPLGAMEYIWPELRSACRVFKPSSSSGVYRLGDEPPTKFGGFHLYVLVRDQRQSAEILKSIEARAWAEGLGWIKISSSGSLLVRSIFDTTVGAPERLVFAGPPELGPGVERVIFPIEWQEGLLLDAPAFPNGLEWKRRIAEAKENLRPSAQKSEREWQKRQVRKSVNSGAPVRDAIRAVKVRLNGYMLNDDTILDLNDGSTIRVDDLLDKGEPLGGRLSLPSPLDGIEYGRGKATLLWATGAHPIIVDHAHGMRRRFTFARYEGGGSASVVNTKFFSVPDVSASSRREITRALQKADATNARNQIIAVSKRLFWSVPAEWPLSGMLDWIRAQVAHCTLPSEFWHELQAHMERWLQSRRAAVTATAAVQPLTTKRHNVRRVQSLLGAVSDLPTGVLLVQAPLGAGKTQHIGAPLVSLAKGMGLTVMAICHRVTLTTELASRLNLAHYQTATPEGVANAGGVAVCLPSIKRTCFWPQDTYPDVVFIDEIRQVIDFLADTKCFNAAFASAKDIYDHLTLVIKKARLVVGADAHLNDRTIQFLEKCRPGEVFTTLKMSPSVRSGQVEFRHGAPKPVRSCIVDAVISELVAGGKVWLACESRELAEALDKHLRELGYISIAITAGNKGGTAQAAFLSDADAESRQYDVVVSSPAISSGISIEHRQGEHFTLGVFIGGGHAILPTDAVQQIGRVRYLERILIGVMKNNLHGRIQSSTMLAGRADALELQQTTVALDDYARLAAAVEADGRNARTDFAAALFWFLEGEGWTVRTVAASLGTMAAEEARAGALTEKLERLNATPQEAVAEVVHKLEDARRNFRPDSSGIDGGKANLVEFELRLEAARIRECLGITEILPEDYKLWDGGNLTNKISHFESLVRADAPNAAGFRTADFWTADLSSARWRLYRDLFEGIDIRADGWLSPDVAEQIVDRIMMRPAAFAAVGIVGPKFYSTGSSSVPKRPASAGKAVGEIMARAGLALRGEQRRVSQMRPVLVNTNGTKCDRSRARVYSTIGFLEVADLLRLRQWRESGSLFFRETPRLSIKQLRRSLPKLQSEAGQILQKLVDNDDGHREAHW